MAHSLAKAGVDFVTIPVLSNKDKQLLLLDVQTRITQIEKEAEKEETK